MIKSETHKGSGNFHILILSCGRSLTALMITDVGVLTLKENPSFFAPLTRAPSSGMRKAASKKAHGKLVIL